MTSHIGQQLGDYRILESIGAGGMGQVYLAEHVHLRKRYALKILPAELARSKGFVARFHDEARVMAELRHPGIVEVQYMGHAEGIYFLVMDYVTGPQGKPVSLHDYLSVMQDGRMPEAQVRTLALQIAEALAYAHQRGVVHRDIKPANILLDVNNHARLTDFGLAKAIGQDFILSRIHQTMQQTLSVQPTLVAGGRTVEDSLDAGATIPATSVNTLDADAPRSPQAPPQTRRSSTASSILGTYDYMSPEQRGEGGEVDQRSDIYSFGVLLFRLLTGKRPVGVGKPSDLAPGISRRWDRIVTRCLAYEQKDRYSSAQALVNDLRLMTGRGGRRWLAGFAACLVVAGAGAYFWRARPPVTPHSPPRLPAVTDHPATAPADPVLTTPATARPTQAAPPATQPTAPAITLADVVPARSKALALWEKIKDLDRGQGFAGLLDDADTSQRSAQTFFELSALAEAKAAYDELNRICGTLNAREPARKAARSSRDTAGRAKEQAAAEQAETYALSTWNDAQRFDATARNAFENGDFPQAEKHWAAAKDAYSQAGQQAVAAAKALHAAEQARQAYEQELDKCDQEQLKKFAGRYWTQVEEKVTAATTALAGRQFAQAADAYRQARELLPEVCATAAAEAKKARFEEALKLDPNDLTAGRLKADLQQWKAMPRQLTLDLGNGTTLELLLIPAGEFTMGSPESEPDRWHDERPQHKVRISKPFYMGKYEVTQAQWQAVMADNPPLFKCDDRRPVEHVSWNDCQTFCQKASSKVGRTIRLPTEAEWEYACRAGTSTRFSFGDSGSDLSGYAWYGNNSGGTSHRVGEKKPNGWGLHDLHGNVWEWCQDWYGEYNAASPAVDPTGPSSGTYRVLRGGSWYDDPWYCRSADRDGGAPDYRDNSDVGLRVVVSASASGTQK